MRSLTGGSAIELSATGACAIGGRAGDTLDMGCPTQLVQWVLQRVYTIERWSMYRHILIPTDGSELAEHAVTNGLSLAKSVGAKVTVIIVEEPFNWQSVSDAQAQRALEELFKHAEQIKKHAASVLNRAADAAKQAGVPCDTIQVKDAYPYQAIIATAGDRGCDLIVMASHGRSGLSAIVLGSVTNKVLTHTKTPVLVCH